MTNGVRHQKDGAAKIQTSTSMKNFYYLLILDRSGSMTVVRDQTVSNVNEQIQTIRTAAKENNLNAKVTLALFDSGRKPEYCYVNKNVSEVRDITREDYNPTGGTALRDAVGDGVRTLQKEIGDAIADEDTNILVTIFTDGQENSSVEFSHTTIQRLIKQLSEDKKWTFTFMGAGGIDEVRAVAKSYNIDQTNVLAYENSLAGHKGASSTLQVATCNYMRSLSSDKDTSKDFFAQNQNEGAKS